MSRYLYCCLWILAMPLVLARLLWRARKQPEYLHHLGERFGATPRSARRRIWLHAVSVGETRAAQPLVKAMLTTFPEHEILITHMTPTGRDTSAQLWATEPRVTRCYLPYDLPCLVGRFLERAKPEAGIVMETEVWPNLMYATRLCGVPMLLANARLSERSAHGYRRLGKIASRAYAAFDAVLAQTADDAARLANSGARMPEIVGNLKFDVDIAPAALELGASFRTAVGNRAVILAASTREGEEEPLLAAFTQHAPPEALLVLVPRHPQRFDEVAAIVSKQGLKLQRRSNGIAIDSDTRVWLGDSMGEMVAYYAMADVAVIGGSWEPLGGQNLIEACAVGVPVLVGPHTFNFAEAAQKAIESGAARRCDHLDAALREASVLLQTPKTRNTMAAAGKHFAVQNKGATARTLAVIERLLASR